MLTIEFPVYKFKQQEDSSKNRNLSVKDVYQILPTYKLGLHY